MTDRPTPPPAAGPSDETLAAYLAGDLDEEAATAVEDRLGDPDTVARLDALADALVRLRGVDDVEPPEGFAQRLDARIQDARPADRPDRATVSALDEARSRRTWANVGATAAVLAVLAVGSLAVLQTVGGSGADQDAAMESTAGGDEADDAEAFMEQDGSVEGAAPAPQEAPAAEEGDDTLAVPASPPAAPREDAAVDARPAPAVPPAAEAAVSDPVVVDDSAVSLPSDADVAQLGALPELQSVLGLPVADARQRVQEVQRALGRAPTVQGSPADECLQIALDGYDPPLVVRVQGASYAGQPAAVYVVASSEGGEVVDRGTAVVFEPATCTVLATVPLEG